MDLYPGEVTLVVTKVKAGLGQKVDSEVEEEDSPVEEDSTTKRPCVSSKAEDKDKD